MKAEESVRVFVRVKPRAGEIVPPRARTTQISPFRGTPSRSQSATKITAREDSSTPFSAGKGSFRSPLSALFLRDSPTSLLNARTGEALGFDGVFGPSEDNQAVFARVLQPRLSALLQGTSLAVFMYGQTNSGKTFTMKGDGQPGLLQVAIKALFALLEGQNAQLFRARLSYVEIYNEKVFDLLGEGGALELRERDGALQLGAKEVLVASEEASLRAWAEGEQRRHFAATSANYRSSRSHVLLLLNLELRERSRLGEQRRAQLLLADLAGSENAGRQLTDVSRFKEGTVINKSLLALTSLITRLRAGREGVSFRESKLTRLLQGALGGNCLTAVICTVNADPPSYLESLSTLRFALAVGGVRTSPQQAQASQPSPESEQVQGAAEELRELQTANQELEQEKAKLTRETQELGSRTAALEAELLSVKQLVASLESLNGELTAANVDLTATLETLAAREQPGIERGELVSARKQSSVDTESADRVSDLERRLAAAEVLNLDYQNRLQFAKAFKQFGPAPEELPAAKRVNNSPTKQELKRWNGELRRKLERREEEGEQQRARERKLKEALGEKEGALRGLSALLRPSPL